MVSLGAATKSFMFNKVDSKNQLVKFKYSHFYNLQYNNNKKKKKQKQS